MNKTKRKSELNVDMIGGEPLTQTEKKQLKTYFREQKKNHKKHSKSEESKKKSVSN